MKLSKKAKAGFATFLCAVIFVCGVLAALRSEMAEELAGREAGSLATGLLGTEATVGAIEVAGGGVTVHDLALYDHTGAPIVTAERADVSLSLLAAVKKSPAAAVRRVALTGVAATIEQRADGTLNLADIQTQSGSSSDFAGEVTFEDATVTGRYHEADGTAHELTLTDVTGGLDFSDTPAIKADVSAASGAASLSAKGTLDTERQILSVSAKNVQLADYLPLVPAGLIPAQVEIGGGEVVTADASVYRNHGDLSIVGKGEVKDGKVTVLKDERPESGLPIENIAGFVNFTNVSVGGDFTADVAGEAARVHGNLRFDTPSPAMDLTAEAENFDPAPVLEKVPALADYAGLFAGKARFKVTAGGTFAQPKGEGELSVSEGELAGIGVTNLGAKLRLLGDRLYVQQLHAGVLGGTVTGELEAGTQTLDYTGHLKAKDIDLGATLPVVLAKLPSAPDLPAISGRADADLAVSGTGTDAESLSAQGSFAVRQGAVGALPIDSLTGSFALAPGENLTLDYVSLQMPHHSNVGVEGTIGAGGQTLDLAFYGGHVDLSLLRTLNDKLDFSGFGDFKGRLWGATADPQVEIEFSAQHGKALKQPFDSLVLKAGGSLAGVHIDDFLMENGGRETWLVSGTVGFVGEKNIDLRADCMGARMEDIAALVAPDQPITGNVDNTIHFTGTLDAPEAVGYLHFYRGSYAGVLLSGMDGDYFLKDGQLRLQWFHIFSPMADAVLDGTIGLDHRLNLTIDLRDLDLARVEHKLPYEASGHGTFAGAITGTIESPVFDGTLDAGPLTMNGVTLPRAYGHARYEGTTLSLDRFGFREGEAGSYDLDLTFDTTSHALAGNVIVENASVENLFSLLNQKNENIAGTLSASAIVGGTLENPSLDVEGSIADGTAYGYGIHDVALALLLRDQVLTIEKCEGQQGESGTLSASGTVALHGPIAAKVKAENIDLGLLTRAAGFSAEVVGKGDFQAELSDTLSSPAATFAVTARDGGVAGSTFDTLAGSGTLRHGILEIENLAVEKASGDSEPYRASAKGIVPLRALTAGSDEALSAYEQIHLLVSLDHADLSLLPLLSKQVDWAMGRTEGSVLVTGTAAQPLMDGTLTLTDGALKLKLLETPLQEMQGKLVFSGNRIALQDMAGKMGDGSYTASGQVTLSGLTPTDYHADLALDHLGIASAFYRGPLTGSFHIEEGDFFGRKMPKLSGNLEFNHVTISVPGVPDGDGELPEVLLDLSVTAGDDVHFYSASLYDMYITGSCEFHGTTRRPNGTGSFTVKRGGTVTYLGNIFRIREGTATFDQVGTFMPSLTFFADTQVGRTRIVLGLRGALSNKMDVILTSNPPYSETEILRMLTLRSSYHNGSASLNANDMLNLGLQMSVLGDIEDEMRSLLWLDTFRISRGSGSALEQQKSGENGDDTENVYNVEMGKRLSDKFALHYVRGIGEDVNRYGLQYDVSDNIGLMVDREGSDFLVGMEARYRF